jgi:hypothetical protein
MITRRTLLAALAATAVLQSASLAYAASPLKVDIIALGHWPVQKALKPVREALDSFGGKIQVQEYDAEADDGKALIENAGKHGHVPVLILIDGSYKFTRADGSEIEFFSFPSGADNPLGLKGGWDVEDVKNVINNKLGG